MIRFEKWEGLGNDFILVEAGDAAAVKAIGVTALCDRRLGVGADGVVFCETLSDGRLKMMVLNADGSSPEMCGNGLRCVVAWAAQRAGRDQGAIEVLTGAGWRLCSFDETAQGELEVTADMGVARLGEELVLDPDGKGRRFALVDVGNPHAVSFEPFDDAELDELGFDDAELDELGPRIDRMRPGGSNVELCRLRDGRIEVAVWERGVGRTQACGTGACAVAAAACQAGLVPFDRPIEVVLPGGALAITVARADLRLSMRGPARRTFRGEIG